MTKICTLDVIEKQGVTADDWRDLFSSYQNYKRERQEKIDKGINDYCLLSTVLKVHDETRLHSRFIASLLDSRGSHYKQGLFTSLLLSLLPEQLQMLQPDKVETQLEVATGKLDKHEKQGFIDILISDGQYYWIIENKLNARDQSKQMARYIDWARELYGNELSPDQLMFIYLTNNKSQPNKSSRGNYKIVKEGNLFWVHEKSSNERVCRYLNLHYHDHICVWLETILKKLPEQDQMRPPITDYQTALNRYLKKDKSKVNTLGDFINSNLASSEKLEMLKDLERSMPLVKAQWLTKFMTECEEYIYQQELVDITNESEIHAINADLCYCESAAANWFRHASPYVSDKGKDRGIFFPLSKEVLVKNGLEENAYLAIVYGKRKLHVGLFLKGRVEKIRTLDKRSRWKKLPDYSWHSNCVDLAEDIWLMGKKDKLSLSIRNLETMCKNLKEGRIKGFHPLPPSLTHR